MALNYDQSIPTSPSESIEQKKRGKRFKISTQPEWLRMEIQKWCL